MEACSCCGKSGDSGSIRRCSRCKAVRYCSRDCQARDWSRHKVTCKEDNHATPSRSQTERRVEDSAHTAAEEARASGEGSAVDADSHSAFRTCQKCKRQGTDFKKCSNCQKATYCSRDCQRGDWKDHKATCKSTSDVTRNGAGEREARARGATASPPSGDQALSQRDRARWANLFGTLYQDPWEHARSRAVTAFPGARVTDVFRGLDLTFDLNVASVPFMPYLPFMPFMPMAFMPFMGGALPFLQGECDAVLVVRALSRFLLPSIIPVHGWLVEDSGGNQTRVVFDVMADPSAHFREEAVEEGQFLCVRHPQVIMFDHGGGQGHFIMVQDTAAVRAFSR